MSWNRSAEEMFGYSADEMIGQSIRHIIPPDRQHEEDQILQRLASNQRIGPFETVRVRRDGRPIPVSITISPTTDSMGRVIGASKIARDITDQKAREERLCSFAARTQPSQQEPSQCRSGNRIPDR